MSMITELFGEEVIYQPKDVVKRRIRSLPPTQIERRVYLLHDWAAITGVELDESDFIDVGDYNKEV